MQRQAPPIRVPSDDAPWLPILSDFALSYNGFERFGSARALGAVANAAVTAFHADGSLPEDLATARGCLFFEQRRFSHLEADPDAEEVTRRYVVALLARIRELSGGQLPGPPDPLP